MSITAKTTLRKNKHFILDQTRLKSAQRILGAKTETEAVEKALERVISENEIERLASAAHEEFVTEMIDGKFQILDVFGRLEEG